MLLKEIDGRLDMQCTIAVRQSSMWTDMASRIPGKTAATAYSYRDRFYMQFFFQKNALPENISSAVKAAEGAMEKNSYYSISEELHSGSLTELITRFTEIPSAIVSESYVEEGEFYITIRFHRSVTDKLNIVAKDLYRSSMGRIVYLGPGSGMISIIEEIDTFLPLTAFRFTSGLGVEMPAPGNNDGIVDSVSETDGSMNTDEGVKIVFYPDGEINWADPVSREDLIYQRTAHNPFLKSLIEGAFQAAIPYAAMFGRNMGGRLQITTFVPTMEFGEFTRIFYTLAGENKESDAMVDFFSPLSRDLWEWI